MLGGKPLHEAMDAMQKAEADTVITLENDLYRRAPHAVVDEALNKSNHLISLDHTANSTTRQADVVLPAGSFAESDGTLINNEGRAQRFYQVYVTENDIHESWRWLREIFRTIGRGDIVEDLQALDDFTQRVIQANETFQPMEDIAPPPGFRIHGQKIPRQSHRYSGRTAMRAHKNVSEEKPPDDPDSPLSFTMEGFRGQVPSSSISYFWAPGWSSIQSVNKFQIEVGGRLHGGDPGKRLIEPTNAVDPEFYQNVPEPFHQKDQAFQVIPLYHIFGSEVQSMNSRGIQERSVNPYLALNPKDAEQLDLRDGASLTLESDQTRLTLPAHI
jgi:NADH-quinone oxidoreductase subunit G